MDVDELKQVREDITRTALVVQALKQKSEHGYTYWDSHGASQFERLHDLLTKESEIMNGDGSK